MTARPLVRYMGAKRAYVGAIGYAVCDATQGGAITGVEIGGRVLPVRSAPPALYQVHRGADVLSCWDSWAGAVADLAMRAGDAAGAVLDSVATPCGVEAVDGDTVWRIVPV